MILLEGTSGQAARKLLYVTDRNLGPVSTAQNTEVSILDGAQDTYRIIDPRSKTGGGVLSASNDPACAGSEPGDAVLIF